MAMDAEAERLAVRSELFAMEAEARSLVATLTAAMLTRIAMPSDRDEAADYAVELFWRIARPGVTGAGAGAAGAP